MSLKKKDFYGKDVAVAIKKACEELKVPQEELDIEVIETGSTGIFGLIRKKTHIRAAIKAESENKPEKDQEQTPVIETKEKEVAAKVSVAAADKVESVTDDANGADEDAPAVELELSKEEIDSVSGELGSILELMGYPSNVVVEATGNSITCTINSEFEEVLIGQDGKTLDSMQYLLRKMIARKIPHRLRLSVDVGNYRERRREELKVKAVELAAQVKEDGKTQVIPALSPSERRVVHMTLQSDKEIRSRSVGDGLFKKILIYKPGKGKKGGGRKYSRSRKNSGPRKKKE